MSKYDDAGQKFTFTAQVAEEIDDIDDVRGMVAALSAGRAYYETRFKAVRANLVDLEAELEDALQRNRDKDEEIRRRGRECDAWQEATGADTADDVVYFRERADRYEEAVRYLCEKHFTARNGATAHPSPTVLRMFVEQKAELNDELYGLLGLDVETDKAPDVNSAVRELKSNLADAQQENRLLAERLDRLTDDPRPLKAGQKFRITDDGGSDVYDVGDVFEARRLAGKETDRATDDEGDTWTEAQVYVWSTASIELID